MDPMSDEDPTKLEYPSLGSTPSPPAEPIVLPPPIISRTFEKYDPVEPEEKASQRKQIEAIAEAKPPLSVALDVIVAIQGHPVVFRALAAIVGVVWWWTFRRWRHPLTWLAGVVPFLLVLFAFYYFLERALPAGY